MIKKELTCICCPMGCALNIEIENNEVIKISGNTCKRGDTYGRAEIIRPMRMVTTIVKVENGKLKMLPVKTKEPIDKDKISQCIYDLKDIKVKAPVRIGDIIASNIAGVDIIATRNVEAIRENQN